MILLFAQPYNICASGFYFKSAEEFTKAARGLIDDYGQIVEEFEIQFIEGESIDADLGKAWDLSQANFAPFFRAAEEWSEDEKIRFIVAVGECGYRFDPQNVHPDDFDVDLYIDATLQDLAIQFVEEGLFGEVPKSLEHYIDYDAIARDLAADYTETEIGGQRLVYRCG